MIAPTLIHQHHVLSQLLAVSREQGRALAGEQLEHFLDLMETRDRLFIELTEGVNTPPPGNVVPFPTLLAGSGEDDVRDAMQGLLRSILQQDEENERQLRDQMQAMQSVLRRLSRERAAGQGYASALAAGSTVNTVNLAG